MIVSNDKWRIRTDSIATRSGKSGAAKGATSCAPTSHRIGSREALAILFATGASRGRFQDAQRRSGNPAHLSPGVVAIVHEFQQIAARAFGERGDAQIVDNQHFNLGRQRGWPLCTNCAVPATTRALRAFPVAAPNRSAVRRGGWWAGLGCDCSYSRVIDCGRDLRRSGCRSSQDR